MDNEYEGLAKAGSFHPRTGTGQGDVFSPQTWVAVFGIVICALNLVDHPDGFRLTSVGGGIRAIEQYGSRMA